MYVGVSDDLSHGTPGLLLPESIACGVLRYKTMPCTHHSQINNFKKPEDMRAHLSRMDKSREISSYITDLLKNLQAPRVSPWAWVPRGTKGRMSFRLTHDSAG